MWFVRTMSSFVNINNINNGIPNLFRFISQREYKRKIRREAPKNNKFSTLGKKNIGFKKMHYA